MKLKLDEQGHVVVQGGHPVYVKEDGNEIAVDAAKAFSKIGQLNSENASYKRRIEETEAKLKTFDGIEDPAKAIEALQMVANLDAKKMMDAGDVEKLKAEIGQSYQKRHDDTVKSFQAKLDEEAAKSKLLEQQLYTEMVDGAFSRSKFIAERMVLPPDIVRAYYGKNFRIEGNRIIAKDNAGRDIYSGNQLGELAGFDEALEVLVNQDPNKDSMLRGTGSSGGGAPGGSSSNSGVTKGNFGGTKAERLAAIRGRFPGLVS